MLGRHARESTLFVGDDEYVHLRRPSLGHPLPSRAGIELHGLASWLRFSDSNFFFQILRFLRFEIFLFALQS